METPKIMKFCLEPMTFLRHRFQNTPLKLQKRTLLCEESCLKFIVVLIHQAIGFGVSATAARWKLVVASAMGNEACAGGSEDDEDVLPILSDETRLIQSVWPELGLRKRKQRCQPIGCNWAAAANPFDA